MNTTVYTTKKSNGGYAALLTIVVVGAASLLMAYSASVIGLGELDLGYTSQKGDEALSMAEGCLEEALYRLRLDTGYSGGSLTRASGSCTISVSGSGSTRSVSIVADIGSNFYKNLDIDVSLAGSSYPTITITDWNEAGG